MEYGINRLQESSVSLGFREETKVQPRAINDQVARAVSGKACVNIVGKYIPK